MLGNQPVRSFVEVHFQRRHQRTTVFEGPSPQWNESLSLSFTPNTTSHVGDVPSSKDDSACYTEAFQTVRDKIYCHLFDEYVVDILEDERERGKVVHQRRERNWLGTVEIPFSIVYEQGKVEGQFHVKIPPVLLGYQIANPRESLVAPGGMFPGSRTTSETMLHLLISLQPPLPLPSVLRNRFVTEESAAVLHRANEFMKKAVPKRTALATVIDIDGKTTLITRFICRQSPPPSLSEMGLPALVRFVSLIPYLCDKISVTPGCEIWSTSDQFLELCAGDYPEHAILLCNYILSLGMEAYVLLGKGVPEGRTAYVLAKEPPAISKPETWMLINPVTGDCYGQTDAHCPLREIGCVFNSKNIWLNVHAYADPARVNFFGITRSRAEWHPFFDKFGNAEPAATVQVRDLAYREVALKVLKELERQIDRTLTAKIEQWRGRHTTKWNRLCSKTFAGLLTYFEPAVTVARPPSYSYSPTTVTTAASSSYGAAAVAGDTAAEEAHYRELQRLRGAYRVAGFPLHQSFTDVDSVVEAVHATDVFSVEDPQAEFALAVACNGYPCDVVSVWVYVASLTPLKHVRW